MIDLSTLRNELDEIFQPAIRWATSQPIERESSDYTCAMTIVIDLTWGGRWKVSQVREEATWIITAVTRVQDHQLSATAMEDDYVTALVALHAALIRRIDRIEDQLRKQDQTGSVAA